MINGEEFSIGLAAFLILFLPPTKMKTMTGKILGELLGIWIPGPSQELIWDL
jgi:hypothetical protein